MRPLTTTAAGSTLAALALCTLAPVAAASDFGAALHYSRWDGSYTSQGIGTRLRWEPLDWFGIELTSELLATEGKASSFEIPAGFQAYFPYTLGYGVRVRALVGTCAMVTLSRQSDDAEYDSGDDIRLGFQLGGGAEVELGKGVWLFTDAKWERYIGHDGKVSAWSSAIDSDLSTTDRLAVNVGLGIEL